MRLASEFKLLAPWAITALGVMAVFVLSLMIWSHEVDAGERAREENLVLQGVLARVTEIEQAVAVELSAADAATKLDDGVDEAWTETNLPVKLAAAAEFDDVVVLNGDDRQVYPDARSVFARLSAGRLIAEVRAAEAARAKAKWAPAPHPGQTQAVQRSAFTAVDGTVRLVTATLILPERLVPGRRAAIVLTGQTVTSGLLTLLRDRFQVAPITAGVEADRRSGLASISFETDSGKPLVMSWAPQRPGADLMERAGWPVLAVILTFGAIGLMMMMQLRRATRELIASNRAQSEFLANMSHEIRTPLNGVVAIADALGRSELTKHQSELVEIIRSSGVTLERLLSDVLDLARIETGAVAIETEPFSLGDAVRSAIALHRSRAEEKGITLTLEMDPSADAAVMGDQIRLKQILTNLLSNAIKFTGEGGVTVEVAPVGAHDRWRFSVEDTGVGFDPALRERIFGRFQQADGSVTRKFGGTGLGLAICKQLAELMGGSIDAFSKPGVGSRFTALIPLPFAEGVTMMPAAQPAVAPLAAPAAVSEAGPETELEVSAEAAERRRLRVLLADDHPTNRRVVEVLLAGLDIDLVSTEHGLAACEAFEAAPFDAVLMDMQMPVMDGLSATRRIRAFEARERLSPTFLCMLTANALRDHHDASIAAGADVHLPKPIEAAKLFAALQQAGEKAARAEAA